MWIFDSYYKGSVELWARKRGLYQESIAYPQFFYLYLKDPHAYMEMIEALESRYQELRAQGITISPGEERILELVHLLAKRSLLKTPHVSYLT